MVTSHWEPPGCLTGHRVRFDGHEGKAGTYHPDGDRYTFIPSEGWTRQVDVSAKRLEDLGEDENDPLGKWDSSPILTDAKCHRCKVDTKHNKFSKGEPTCWKCKLAISEEIKAAKARR